ncbi:hypothetical protein [Bergeriella denitrificans]|uniref:Uncharacterized protein n=1 Tax=Bergeriella denitrificans TaxID=494 RepID=A0A378UGB3_BERDE|nr:hypothetical protein [Bergeriella denitrificans]STZ76335.1 Uncharacterised protein [Bergeriella denitrificans]
MTKIKVRAAEGLNVPMEHDPYAYIGADAVEVDGDSLYYRCLLADGDLVAAEDAAEPDTGSSKPAKTQKGSE